MSYKITVSPDLDIDVADLVEQWNASPEAKAVATAQISEENANSFSDPITLTAVLVGVASGVAVNVLTNLLTDLIKKRLFPAEEQPTLHLQITSVTQADGTTILVVDRE